MHPSSATDPAPSDTILVPGRAAELDALMRRLHRGTADPTLQRDGREWWRTSTTPEGPVLLRLRPRGADVQVSAWGAGSAWALAQAPRLLGGDDRPEEFALDHPRLGAVRRTAVVRVGATDRLAEALAPVVIEQRVTGAEAFFAQRTLLRRFGSPPPGPRPAPGHPVTRMRVPPTAPEWASIPSWEYLRAGVEQARSRPLVAVMQRVASLERLLALPVADEPGVPAATVRGRRLGEALCSLRGIGPWTAALVRQQVLGDPDAWSIDDYHVPSSIALALAGDADHADRADELLECYRPHRYRVELVVSAAGIHRERHGPRRSVPGHLPTRFGRG